MSDFRRGVMVGSAFTLVLGAAGFCARDAGLNAAIAVADHRSDSIEAVLTAERDSVREALRDQAKADSAADVESTNAQPIANRLGEIIDRVKVRSDPDSSAEAAAGDTVRYVGVTRTGDPRIYRVPLWVAEDRDSLVQAILKFKMAWESERSARLLSTNITVPRLVKLDMTSTSLIASQKTAIQLRDASRRPRCGAKCGALLTVGTIVVIRVAQLVIATR